MTNGNANLNRLLVYSYNPHSALEHRADFVCMCFVVKATLLPLRRCWRIGFDPRAKIGWILGFFYSLPICNAPSFTLVCSTAVK